MLDKTKPYVITIGRQYGSGGRELGKNLAERLNIPYYDKELVTSAARECDYPVDKLEKVDEKAVNSFLFSLATCGPTIYNYTSVMHDLFVNDVLFNTQSNIIKRLASEHSCIIIGRCGDYVLRDHPNKLSVFIYGDIETRVKRVENKFDIPASMARSTIQKIDKRRANYYHYYTGQKWENAANYDMTLNSGVLGVENCLDLLADYLG